MKMLYISSIPLPSRYANRLQVVKMSEAFARKCDFTLCVSGIQGDTQSVFDYYHVLRPFRIIQLGRAPRFGRTIVLSLRALRVIRRERPDVLFIREAPLAFILSFFRLPIVFEVHDFPEQRLWLHRFLFAHVTLIVSTNRWKAERLEQGFGIHQEKVMWVPNGVDGTEFGVLTREEARSRLNLPLHQKIVMYTGQLFSWKGGDVLYEASRFLKEFRVLFVGGTEQDQRKILELHGESVENVTLLPHQPHHMIATYLSAADVLVVPNTAREEISRFSTSPLKLFEYLASKRPVVCSDIPSMREIVDERDVWFFAPDDPRSLAMMIKRVVADPSLAEQKVRHGYETVSRYTWDMRARSICLFIKETLRIY